jgi:hypothetical protein
MEFQIGVVEEGGGSSGAAPAPLSQAEMEQLKKQFGDVLAQMIAQRGEIGGAPVTPAGGPSHPSSAQQSIDTQITPVLAANAAAVAAVVRHSGDILPALEDLVVEGREPGAVLPTDLRLQGELPGEAAARQHRHEEREKAAVANIRPERDILPPLEEMQLVGIEPNTILPADLRLEGELPGAAADRARREAKAKAARENVELGPAEIPEPPEVIDLAQEQAKAQIAAGKHAARVKAARENIEKGPAEVINPADEAREKQLKDVQNQLNSGSRIAAQAGLGATGQLIGGAADLGVGLATGNVVQAVEGGLEVLQATVHMTAEAFDSMREKVELVSHQVQAAAANDYYKILDNQLEDVSKALSRVPITGEALAAAFDAAVSPVRAFHDVVGAFVERGKQLQGFSGELSQAGAMAEVRTLLDDLREADRLGPDLARLTEAQSELGHEFRELVLPIKEWLLEHLAAALETLVEVVKGIRVGIEEMKEITKILQELLNDIFGSGKVKDVPNLIASIDGRLRDAAARVLAEEDDKKFRNLFEKFFAMRAPRREVSRREDAARDAIGPERSMRIPILTGF